MARRRQIFTVFDKLEQDGYFESNPANPDSRGPQGQILYKGPVKFPRMVYHPQGLEKIIVAAIPQMTALGPKMMGEQRELISKVCETETEYTEAKAAGWLDTPAESIAKRPAQPVPQTDVLTSSVPQTEGLATLMSKFEEMSTTMDGLIASNAALAQKNADLEAKLAEA